MTTTGTIIQRATANDGTRDVQRAVKESSISDVVGEAGKRETVSLSAAFNALSPPTGAAFVMIRWISGTGSLTLKGVTGDTGIALGTLAASSPAIMLPISSPSIGILSDASGSVEVLWL
ncbi:MAG: hypothetical protein VW547_02020 [Alphaproteobacteria bacterium]